MPEMEDEVLAAGGDGRGERSSDTLPSFFAQVLDIVLENVLLYLTSRRDRNAASLVCRSWWRAEAQTRSELFISNCYAVSPGRAIERFRRVRAVVLKGKPLFANFKLFSLDWGEHLSPWLYAIAPAYPWLERLCLKSMTITDEDLSLLAQSLPGFRDLSLTCCDGFTTAGLAAVAEKCRHLRTLDLIENYWEEEEEEVVDWVSRFPETVTNLESLVFDCVGSAVNFEALEALVGRSPGLWRLQVNRHISARQLQCLMARAPQLTHLGTGSFHTTPGDLEIDLWSAFAASRSLVSLSGFQEVAPELLPTIFPVCNNLTSLNFSFAAISASEFNPIISHCCNLQNLEVLDSVRDEGLVAVSAGCKNLCKLRVYPCHPGEGSVSDVGLVAISEGCRKLQSILYFCQRMTNDAVIALSKNCPELLVFRLCIMRRQRPDHLTGEPMDEGFGAIVMNCKKLTRLAVSGLLTDKAFWYIGKYGKLVRTLSVAFAGNSDQGLRYLLEGCDMLQKLQIRDSPFGDSGLLSGLHHYYNMRFLSMSSCKLSIKGCLEVARMLPDLVVEVIADGLEDDGGEAVEVLYMYRSLEGPRNDLPPYVKILK